MERKATNKKANEVDQQYCDLFIDVCDNGVQKEDRTGTGTISVFGRQLRFNMQDGFPLLTSKRMYVKGIITELLWFLGKHLNGDERYDNIGRTNIRYLVDNNCNIWVGDVYKKYLQNCRERKVDPLAKDGFINSIKNGKTFAGMHGNLGPVYGKQWMDWGGEVNQIRNLIDELKTNPDSRRLIVNAWNVSDLDKMVLPPCHYGFQCYTTALTTDERYELASATARNFILKRGLEGDHAMIVLNLDKVPQRTLSLMWNQRSVDTPLGLPFNIASYGFLLHILADMCGMIPGELIGNLGDTHIYNNQLEGVEKQLANPTYPLPKLKIKEGKREKVTDYNIEDFEIVDYQCAGFVEYPLSN